MMNEAVILSSKATAVIDLLENTGIKCFSAYNNSSVSENISDHADISFFFDGDDTLFVAKEEEVCAEQLKQFCENIIVLPEYLNKNYPDDVKLNCVRVGSVFICNTNTVSTDILEHMKAKKLKILDVKQGYTKCSVVPVSENAIITDDISIYNGCNSFGIDALLVSKGDVRLNGFDYGFIGGCSGKISNNTVIFSGNIRKHRDCKKILDFLSKYNVKYYCPQNELTDIGSILPIYKV